MKTTLSILLFLILMVGCTEIENKFQTTAASPYCKPRLSKWLQGCTIELAKHQTDEIHLFNDVGSNDAMFIPTNNPTEEIFQKCQSIQPLSAKDVPIYKECLENCISEMQSINQSTTREEVNNLLQQNGGLYSAQEAIYSHLECDVLKVRVEFEFQKDKDGRAEFNDSDKVKAISMPYLGFFILD